MVPVLVPFLGRWSQVEYPLLTSRSLYCTKRLQELMNVKMCSWLSAASLVAALFFLELEQGRAFLSMGNPKLVRSGTSACGRVRGFVSAVQSVPPPSTASIISSSSSLSQKAPWSPDSWRKFTPRQMPVYDDEVSHYESVIKNSRYSEFSHQCSDLTLCPLF